MGITGSLAIGIAIFLGQYAICRLWTSHHSHGPLEWMWKRATWIEIPPFLRRHFGYSAKYE